ncbi:MAG: beta-N-acetylhexosaminidase [Deltaproteobacteria bacterium]|nr:beta-N-acetylhexosaminidase [Deltaproteobacteria bacterium]
MPAKKLIEQIGQFFMIRFSGTEPSSEVERLIKERFVGGVILFASNLPHIPRAHEMILRLQSLAPSLPLCVAVDHEGGRVHRLPKPATRFPPMRRLGKLYERLPSSSLALEVGRVMGRELKALGFDLNFAPVADVDVNPSNPVIGDRSPSSHEEVVSIVAAQLVRGMQEEGVAACAKHFPGHGDTSEDSHEALPQLPHNMKRLRSLELVPFQAAIQQRVAAVMPAHVVYDGVDKGMPATFSVKILRDILRTELGFEGLIISDDLTMGALKTFGTLGERCAKAFLAGCDCLLALGSLQNVEAAMDDFAKAVEAGLIPSARVDQAFERIALFKERFCDDGGEKRPSLKTVGAAGHKDILNKIKYLT